ncbi:MAG: Wzz/FepE/Etk N-terminal domain-containing protein [Marmoricola sp.]
MNTSTTRTAVPTSNLRSLVALLWRRKAVVVLVLVLVGLVVGAGLASAQRTYTAVARVAATPSAALDQSAASYSDLLGTLADVASSRPLLEDVQRSIGSRSLATLQDEVKGSVIFGTVIVEIAVTDRNPVIAAQAANAVANALPSHDPGTGYFEFATTQPAEVPTTFTSPNLKIGGLAGAVLAVVLAIASAVLYDRATRTVDTVDEAAAATGANVLGVVRRPRAWSAVSAAEIDSPEYPSLRALRVALEFATTEDPTRTLVVAPAVPDPSGGWLEVNLAVALAEVGHRVLLIDACADGRRRHPALDAAGAPGLFDMLAGTVSLDGARISGPVANVCVVPVGNPDLAAPSLLEMRVRRLLDDIDEKYDVVLVRAAAVSESDDARIIAIDGSLLLTLPAGRVRPGVLASVIEDLHEVRVRLVGAVLLGVKARRRSRR